MLTAIIVAAGSSQRMGFDKLFALLDGKPVFAHSIDAFEQTKAVGEIIIVGRNDRLGELEEIVRVQKWKKVRQIVAGGMHRQDSVRAGLACVSAGAEYVAVHDAARPLVTPEQIERVFDLCLQHGGAALAEPIIDTVKRASEEGFVCASIERDQLYAMQTPQIFSRALLDQAYAAIAADNVDITDEVSALQHLGHKVVLVPNEEYNFKITYPADLTLAAFVIRERQRLEGARV
ncbi:MAG: 2-C-methyl-D-erythritol 4-phosphate cytidylyltransferase [Verrucomicrobiota bacterium]